MKSTKFRNYLTSKITLQIAMFALVVYITLIFIGVPAISKTEFYQLPTHPDGYGDIATSLAAGNGYRFNLDTGKTMLREPGYILLTAGIYFLFDNSPNAARIANVILVFTNAFLLFLLCKQAGLCPNLARLSSLTYLAFPYTVFSVLRISPEILFTTLFLSTMWWMIQCIKSERALHFALAGLFLGLTALVRSIVIPFVMIFIFYAVFTIYSKNSHKKVIQLCLVFLTTFCVVYSPWPLRNLAISGEVIITATVSGDALYQGMYTSKMKGSGKQYYKVLREASQNQMSILKSESIPFIPGFFQYHTNPQDEIRHRKALSAAALNNYRENPILFVRTFLRNTWAFWAKGRQNKATYINLTLVLPLLTLALIGLLLSPFKTNNSVRILIIFGSIFYLTHLPIFAHARHSVPMIPILILFSSFTLKNLIQKLCAQQKNQHSRL